MDGRLTSALETARGRRRGLQAALADLEEAVTAPASGRVAAWSATAGQRLLAVRDALRHHVEATEAPDGLFAEVLDHAPRLAKRVEQLRADHETLARAVDDAYGGLPAEGTDEDGAARTRERVVSLLADMSRHRHLGADLVYEAYHVDISASD
jgi:hypothetical protein